MDHGCYINLIIIQFNALLINFVIVSELELSYIFVLIWTCF